MRRFSKILSGLVAASMVFSTSIIPQKNESLLDKAHPSFPLILTQGIEVYAGGMEDAAYKFADPEMEKLVRDEIIAKTPLVVTVGSNKPLNAEKVYAAAHAPITNKQIANLYELTITKKYKLKTYKDLKNFSKLASIYIEKENLNKTDFWGSIKDLECMRVMTIVDENYTDLAQLFQTKAKNTLTSIDITSMDKKMLMQLKNMKSLMFIFSGNNRKIENFDGVELPYGCMGINMGNSVLKNIDGLRNYPLNTLIVSGKNLEIHDPSFKKDYYGAAIVTEPYLSVSSTKFAESIKNIKIKFPNELEEKIFKIAVGKKTDAALTYGDVIDKYEVSLDETKLESLKLTQEQKEQFIAHYLQRTDFIPPGLNICKLSIDVEALIKRGIINEKNVNYIVLLEEQIPTEYLYNIERPTVGNVNLDLCKIKVFHPDANKSSFLSSEYYNKIQHYALVKTIKSNKIGECMDKAKHSDFKELELLKARFAYEITVSDVNKYRTNIQSKIQKGEYTRQRADEEENKLGTASTQRIVKYMQGLGLKAYSEMDGSGKEKIKFTVNGKEYICEYDKFTDLRSFGITSDTAHLLTNEVYRYTADYYKIAEKALLDIANDEREYYIATNEAKPKKTLNKMDYFKVKAGW